MSKEKVLKLENHALRRLAHLMAGGDDQNTLNEAHDFLIEQTLLEGNKGKSPKEIRSGVQSLFLLRFSLEEVGDSLLRLQKNSRIVERSQRFSLEVKREGELKKLNSDTKAQEKKIYSNWAQDVLSRYPSLPPTDIDLLLQDLKEYIHKVFLEHGAECSVFIYPEKEHGQSFLEDISGGEIDKILPTRGQNIKEIRQIEFPLFLQNIDLEKRSFFSKLLDGTFIYSIIQVDQETINILRGRLKNYIFYLDTNIIYSLLDLNSHKKSSSIEKAFNLARNFGMNFVTTSRTIEEMNKSIELKSKELLGSGNIRRDLALEGADLSEECTGPLS